MFFLKRFYNLFFLQFLRRDIQFSDFSGTTTAFSALSVYSSRTGTLKLQRRIYSYLLLPTFLGLAICPRRSFVLRSGKFVLLIYFFI